MVEDRRLFRLDRVADVELLDTPVTEHAAAEPLDLSEGIYRPSADDLLARLRVAPQARWVTEYFPVEEVDEEADGSLTVALRVGNPAWLVRLALRLGGHAVVLEPEELAEAVRHSAEEALRGYG
jgi:proteasome accessory factor C